eukprot:scaffold250550_cov31-Tisochrysis_lutea.AAC.1
MKHGRTHPSPNTGGTESLPQPLGDLRRRPTRWRWLPKGSRLRSRHEDGCGSHSGAGRAREGGGSAEIFS